MTIAKKNIMMTMPKKKKKKEEEEEVVVVEEEITTTMTTRRRRKPENDDGEREERVEEWDSCHRKETRRDLQTHHLPRSIMTPVNYGRHDPLDLVHPQPIKSLQCVPSNAPLANEKPTMRPFRYCTMCLCRSVPVPAEAALGGDNPAVWGGERGRSAPSDTCLSTSRSSPSKLTVVKIQSARGASFSWSEFQPLQTLVI